MTDQEYFSAHELDDRDLQDELQREREQTSVAALLRCADAGVRYVTLAYLAGELGVRNQFNLALDAREAALRG